ncbi:MAG: substrate-binding domain-containing protein [Eisenbergiella sp.]
MPTIFLSDLDYIALGAMQSLKEHGYRIPDDISIVGFDDVMASALRTAAYYHSGAHGTIAGIAVKILIDKLAKPDTTFFSTVQVSSRFIIRDSVRRL